MSARATSPARSFAESQPNMLVAKSIRARGAPINVSHFSHVGRPTIGKSAAEAAQSIILNIQIASALKGAETI